MLTRALMLSPFPPVAPVRTTGRYLGANGQMYSIVWDAATDRLLVYYLGGGFSEIQTAISSQAQIAARTSTGAVGIYNVGSTGIVGDLVASYPFPAAPTGYSAHSYNANAEVLFTSNGGATSGGFQIRNLATGVSSGAISGYANVSTRAATYDVGDGWVTAVPQVNGKQSGNPYTFVTVNNRRALQVNYGVVSPAFPVLGRVAAPAVSPLPPLTGVPFILEAANTVRLVTVSLRSPGILRAGQAFIPATVSTQEVDVQGELVSAAEANWYGYVRADLTSHTFVPLSAYLGYRTEVPCQAFIQQDGSTLYRPTGTAIGSDFSFTKIGQPNLQLTGLQPGLAALYRAYGTQDPASTGILASYVKTVSTNDGSTIAERSIGGSQQVPTSLLALPHLGALVIWSGGTLVDTAVFQISFDGGLNWRQGTAFSSQFTGSQPTIRGAPYADLQVAVPLFLV